MYFGLLRRVVDWILVGNTSMVLASIKTTLGASCSAVGSICAASIMGTADAFNSRACRRSANSCCAGGSLNSLFKDALLLETRVRPPSSSLLLSSLMSSMSSSASLPFAWLIRWVNGTGASRVDELVDVLGGNSL